MPQIADWCSVDILGSDDRLEQLAVAHVDPSKRELAKEWRQPVAATIRFSELSCRQIRVSPRSIPEITDEMIDAGTPDLEQRRMAKALGLRSAMVVPLTVGPKPFGAVTFITAESGRRYGSQDLILATEIARRASLAVENAAPSPRPGTPYRPATISWPSRRTSCARRCRR